MLAANTGTGLTYKWKKGNDEVAGTIALFNLGQHLADLRKMFVKPAYRGKELGVSKKLLDHLLSWAMKNKYEKVYLETTSVLKQPLNFIQKMVSGKSSKICYLLIFL